MFVSLDGKVVGVLGVSDPIKESAAEALEQIREQDIHIVMLTGDNRETAEAVANELGITDVVAEVMPEEKTETVKAYQEKGKTVAMAGDGIPLAAGVLYPVFGLLLSPMIAAAAMSFSSVSVIGNSLCLKTADI